MLRYFLPALLIAGPALAQQGAPSLEQQIAIEQATAIDAITHLADAVRQQQAQIAQLRTQLEAAKKPPLAPNDPGK